MAGIYAESVIATTTVHVGPSADELAERIAALIEHKVLSLPARAEFAKEEAFTEEEKEIARRAIGSVDAIAKANAAIVLGRSGEAREALEPASHVTDDAFRYFTAMGDTFYFEQRFDDAAAWYDRAFRMPGREQDVTARKNLATALQQSRLGTLASKFDKRSNLALRHWLWCPLHLRPGF